MGDLRDRTPGHGLIERLLSEWERGRIHLGDDPTALEVEVEDGAESWYRGVLGERRVGEILSTLPPSWTVLHSVPVGRSTRDIDHVVIGPGGVFTVNTKYSPGRRVWARGMGLYVGDHATSHVRKARDEARDAAERLTSAIGRVVQVTGIVAFVDPGDMRIHPPVGDEHTVVKVVRDSELLDHLHSRSPLNAERAVRIVEAAVRPETWHERPEASPRLGAHLALEFDALRQHIEPGHDGPKVPLKPTRRVPSRRVPSRRPGRPAPARRPGGRRSSRRERALAAALAWLVVAAVAVIGSRVWLSQHASGPAPTPAPTVSVTPTTTPAP